MYTILDDKEGFSMNFRSEKYLEIVDEMVENFRKLGGNMNLKPAYDGFLFGLFSG